MRAQTLISYTHVSDLSPAQVDSIIGDSGPFGVSLYSIVYSMLDHNDELDTVSGLIGYPIGQTGDVNIVVYNHGTTQGPTDAPSLLGSGFSETLAFSSFGFATCSPDYIGLGISNSFHPYVHAETEALSGLYMIETVSQLNAAETITTLGDRLFVAGYSQGGHASMALQQLIETDFSDDYNLKGAAHGSGPFSISDVMKSLITENEVYLPVGFVPYVILGYQEIYGDLYTDLSDIFLPAYISDIEDFRDGNSSVTGLSLALATRIFVQNAGRIVPRVMLQDTIVTRLMANDPSDPLIQHLRENDTYNFQATAPTRLYYCEADDVVPFENSILADSVMQELGATDLQLVHVDPEGDHGECAIQAIPLAIQFFLDIQFSGIDEISAPLVSKVYPNPVANYLQVELINRDADADIQLFDMQGRRILHTQLISGYDEIKLSDIPVGIYTLQIMSDGVIDTRRVLKGE